MNYITIDFTLDTTDADYLVIEIPTKGVYTTGVMHGLASGQRFPCSAGSGLTAPDLLCVFEKGSVAGEGIPMKIIVTNFSYYEDSSTKLNLVISNPNENYPIVF